MTTKYIPQVWKRVGCVEVVDMCLTASIVIFVNAVPRHICVRHKIKSSHVALVGVPTKMDVVVHAINVKVNVVDLRPLTLPQQGTVPVVWVENLVPRKTSVVHEGPVARVVARKTSVVQERPEVRKSSGMRERWVAKVVARNTSVVQERPVAKVVTKKTSGVHVRLVAKVVARKTSLVQERPEARKTSGMQERLAANVVASKTSNVHQSLEAKVVARKTSDVWEKLVVSRMRLMMQAKRL